MTETVAQRKPSAKTFSYSRSRSNCSGMHTSRVKMCEIDLTLDPPSTLA